MLKKPTTKIHLSHLVPVRSLVATPNPTTFGTSLSVDGAPFIRRRKRSKELRAAHCAKG